MPVVTVAPNDALLEKLKSNMQEVRARGGELYVLADADTRIAAAEGVNVIRLPEHYGLLSPILHVVPLQLLAYHTALARGTDVDKPQEPREVRHRRVSAGGIADVIIVGAGHNGLVCACYLAKAGLKVQDARAPRRGRRRRGHRGVPSRASAIRSRPTPSACCRRR